MPIEFDTQLVRRNNADFKLVDDGDVGGGYKTVATIFARDAIQANLRKEGMLVFVQADSTVYMLDADLVTWSVFDSGGGGSLPDQTGQAGKFLTTDGATPSWATSPGGGLPALSGLDGAVLRETEPGAILTFQRLSLDDLDPAFAITSFSPGFTVTKELGDAIVNPSFTASYNALVSSATLDETDTPGPIALSIFSSFAYGTPPLPPRSYTKTAINATVTWTLSATKAGGPIKLATVVAAWRSRVFFQEAVPGAFDEAFIEALTGQALASGFARTIAFGAGGGTKKLYYCYPTSFGSPTQFKDVDTNFAVPFTKVATAVPVTNSFSVLVPGGYDIWESDNFLLSAVNVVVS